VLKIKKSLLCALSCLLLFCIGLCFVGCGDTKDKKYDVAIRIGCSDGKVYEFPIGTDELHVEYVYDGIERKFGVRAYNLPDHPRWSKDWISPSGEGANVFDTSLGKVNQRYDEDDPRSVCERGEYVFHCIADSTSDLWNFRSVRLYITVT